MLSEAELKATTAGIALRASADVSRELGTIKERLRVCEYLHRIARESLDADHVNAAEALVEAARAILAGEHKGG